MKNKLFVITVLWLARILSIFSIGMILMFAIGEGLNLSRFTSKELILFLFFPLGVYSGMVLSWRFEGLGGSITVFSLLLFYLINLLTSHHLAGPAFIIFALPGFLFLFYWLGRRYILRHEPGNQGLS